MNSDMKSTNSVDNSINDAAIDHLDNNINNNNNDGDNGNISDQNYDIEEDDDDDNINNNECDSKADDNFISTNEQANSDVNNTADSKQVILPPKTRSSPRSPPKKFPPKNKNKPTKNTGRNDDTCIYHHR